MFMFKTVSQRTAATLIIMVATTWLWTCSSDSKVRMPQSVAGDQLTEVVRGAAASKIITEMHGKSLGTDHYEIGYYGPKAEKNILYLSIFPDEQTAKQDYMDMSMKMSQGTPVFTPLKVENKGDQVRFTTTGMGKAHFMFRDKETLIWWQGDTARIDEAIADLDQFQW